MFRSYLKVYSNNNAIPNLYRFYISMVNVGTVVETYFIGVGNIDALCASGFINESTVNEMYF